MLAIRLTVEFFIKNNGFTFAIEIFKPKPPHKQKFQQSSARKLLFM